MVQLALIFHCFFWSFYRTVSIQQPSLIDFPCSFQMVESRFMELLNHSALLLKKKWLFGVLDDFTTKQLPHNVTWGLSLLYAMEHKGNRASVSTQGIVKMVFPMSCLSCEVSLRKEYKYIIDNFR